MGMKTSGGLDFRQVDFHLLRRGPFEGKQNAGFNRDN